MRRALNVLISLYPKQWRNRYKKEFEALLDDVSPTWRTLFDVLGGAVKMQFKIWSPWKIIAAFGVVGVVYGFAVTLTIPKRYVSEAVIKIQAGLTGRQLNDFANVVLSRSNLTQVIMQADLYNDARQWEPLEDLIMQMKTKDIQIRPVGSEAKAFVVSVTASDAGRAQRAAQMLAASFVDGKAGTLLDPASLPVSPDGPRLSRNVVMGLAAGLLLGSMIALFNRLRVWKLAASLGFAGAMVGALVAFVLPDRFSSTAVLRYEATDQAAARNQIREVFDAVTSDASLGGVVQRFKLYPGESDPERRLREHLHIEPIGNGTAIMIRFDDRDRYTAQRVVADVVSLTIEQGIQEGIRSHVQNERKLDMTMELVEAASVPARAYSPDRPVVAGGGLFFGLMAAVGIGLWRCFRAPLPSVAAR
jgi:capsular polysaccharide biosynthesis protein